MLGLIERGIQLRPRIGASSKFNHLASLAPLYDSLRSDPLDLPVRMGKAM
jgi:hypothetical protein